MDYYWEASCHDPLHFFSLEKICSYLRPMHGNILIVGDSLSVEFNAVFVNAFYREYYVNLSSIPAESGLERHCDSEIRCIDHLNKCKIPLPVPCPYNLSVHEVRNDRVGLETVFHDEAPENFYDYPWIDILAEHQISLIFLNRGAHYEPIEKVLFELNQTIHFLATSYPNISVIYRSTPTGHATAGQDFYAAPTSIPFPPVPDNHWEEFLQQNEDIDAFLAHYYPQVLFIDFHSSTNLRSDSHIDGLHYCVPSGPLENWVQLVYNALHVIHHA
jgi:hypothetical protein